MAALLIWLAGCIFGVWVIVHWQLWHELLALLVSGAVVLWMVGGAVVAGRALGRRATARVGKKPWGKQPIL